MRLSNLHIQCILYDILLSVVLHMMFEELQIRKGTEDNSKIIFLVSQ